MSSGERGAGFSPSPPARRGIARRVSDRRAGGRIIPAMTEIARPRRYRRRARALSSLRQLAREAAEAGEPLAAIAARLDILPTTLSDWALADGFPKKDLKARAAAAADRVRREAEEIVREAGLDAGASPVKRPDLRFQGMYMFRCRMVWDVVRALFAPGPAYEECLMEDIYLRAEDGWFNGFREKIREAVRRLRDMGNDALADSLEEKLADEATAQAAWAEHDAEKGYSGRRGRSGRVH